MSRIGEYVFGEGEVTLAMGPFLGATALFFVFVGGQIAVILTDFVQGIFVGAVFVAITILPTAARYWMRQLPIDDKEETAWDRLADRIVSLTDSQPKPPLSRQFSDSSRRYSK